MTLAPVAAPALGQIGSYQVLGHLGSGATGDVFLALDPFTGQRVAIKRICPPAVLEAADQRLAHHFFSAEAALVGRLQHPNVVRILDAVDDPQAPYVVMEYAPGRTLRHYCDADTLLPLTEVVELGFKCAMALGYMARQGLTHRDVKPANILVDRDGDRIVSLKLTDFGAVFDARADVTQLQRVGTLAYMAPEQFQGEGVDARADIYSLAAVLYHLIAGRRPFDDTRDRALVVRILHDAPAPLIGARAGVSDALNRVVLQALAKQATDRPADWPTFAAQLAALVAQGQVPRADLAQVLDSERFSLLRQLAFFTHFDDVQLWEVVHRARWERMAAGQVIFQAGSRSQRFHIIAEGEVQVLRAGVQVAQLQAGTSVGEMATLAPSDALREHVADVRASQPCITVSFTPTSLAQLSEPTRHAFDQGFIQVLVRRLHAAHTQLAHPRRIL
jgi:serine/threonine protein kinase